MTTVIRRLRRNSDPETAHIAAAHVAVRLNEKQEAVLTLLREHGGWLTTAEVREYEGAGGLDPGKRMRELWEKGQAERRPRPDSGGQVEYRAKG